jgi:ubiquinol oxidase
MRFLLLAVCGPLLVSSGVAAFQSLLVPPRAALTMQRSSLVGIRNAMNDENENGIDGGSASVKVTMMEDNNNNKVTSSSSASTATMTMMATPTTTKVTTTTTTTSNSPSPPPEKERQMMDARIYNFNKIVIDTVYEIICALYPVKGTARDFARFYVLETVARVPYFAYLSVMHLRETFGDRQDFMSQKMRTHYAEADNELHHLLIMESLGGNSSVVDRTIAQTMAFGYYWYVVAIYSINEAAAYHLSELIEDHAYNTYSKYLKEHEAMLQSLPVPAIARKYYVDDNPFLFDLFCTVKDKDDQGNFSTRRPVLNTLYDVFVNVRDDEKEHWKTLCNLVQYDDMQGIENSKVQPTEPMMVEA